MEIRTNGTIFAAKSSFDEREVLKSAGFWWHGMSECRTGCDACAAKLGKVWWTPKLEIAYKLRKYASPEQKPLFDQLFGKLETQLAASRAAESDGKFPAPQGLDYLGYQKAGIAYALNRPRVLIADEMGLGKTVQALGIINTDESVRTVLVICRKSLRLNWKVEAEKWLMRPFKIVVPDESADLVGEHDMRVLIVNHDKLVGSSARAREFRSTLLLMSYDLIIADEAQDFKNPEAQRSQVVFGAFDRKTKKETPGLMSQAKRIVALTGTPIENRPAEIHGLISALDSQFRGFGFLKRYCGAKQVFKGGAMQWDFSGATNLDELQVRLRSSIMVRRLKADVLTELPPKRRQLVLIEQTSEMRALVNRIDKAAREAFGSSYNDDVAMLDAGGRIPATEMSALRRELAVLKVPQVVEHIQSVLETEAKLLVFAHHHDVINELVEQLSQYGTVVITGDTKEADRAEAVRRFQNDPATRVFIGNIKAAGVGLTLTAASHVVMVEQSWNPAEVCQAEDRAHRMGQKKHVLVQHLVVDGSLEARMAKTIIKKLDVSDRALDRDPEAITIPEPEFKAELKGKPKAPVAPEPLRVLMHHGLKVLAGVCDGASKLDECGFNRFDSSLGKELAARDRLTDGQVWLVKKMLRKYKRQLPVEVVEACS